MNIVRRSIAVGAAVLGVLALGAGSASAETGYGDACTLLGTPAFCAGAKFSFPYGVAVDNSGNAGTAGDVYVANASAGSVLRFKADGEEAPFSGANVNIAGNQLGGVGEPLGMAVESATGDFYVLDHPGFGAVLLDKFTPAGEPIPGMSFALPEGESAGYGVAIDNSTEAGDPSKGDVYVPYGGHHMIYRFNQSGHEVGKITETSGGVPTAVAVDSHGSVYVVNDADNVEKYSPSGTFEAVLDEGHKPLSVTIDPATGDLFVGGNNGAGGYYIQPYTAAGTPLAPTGEGVIPEYGSGGIAASASNDDVYAFDNHTDEGVIFELGSLPAAPITEAASGVTASTAVLHGELNPGAKAKAGWYFAYNLGKTCTGGAASPLEAEAEVQGVKESKEVTALVPSSLYTVCFVAENVFGHVLGAPVTVSTLGVPPAIEGLTASGIAVAAASLEAQVNPENQRTECEFEYGLTPAANETKQACEQGTPAGTLEGYGNQAASVHITGLKGGTKYHYRLVAKNATGETKSEAEFETLPPPPAVTTGAASAVTLSEATVTGTVNPERLPTTYYYQYGTTTEYGEDEPLPPGVEAGGGSSTEPAPATLFPLTPGVTYHYRLVASNEDGTSYGEDETLTTPGYQPPTVSTGPASEISPSTVTLSGTIDPQGAQTAYALEYGTTSSYGSQIFGDADPEHGMQTITLALQNLLPGTTYHYRLAASNSGGSTDGEDETFTTPGIPSPIVAPLTPPLIATPAIAFPVEETGTSKPPPKKKAKAKKKPKHKGRKKEKGGRGKGKKK